jgi:nucleotide-binding universal stress UspA family protein
MKKIILAFEGTQFPKGAFDFAKQLNDRRPILLTGVFVPLVNYASLWSYATVSAGAGIPAIPLIEEEEVKQLNKNIETFETLCNQYNIEYRVHRDYRDFALPELKKETRYADLLILGSETFYTDVSVGDANPHLKDILQEAECPVLIVPETFSFPDSNVLAFDGSGSSVFAIKQFAYLFPELRGNNTLLMYVDDSERPIPDQPYIRELAGIHFPDLNISKLELPSPRYFSIWISDKKKALLVSGAYGRSFVSQLFRKSFISDIIRDHQLPVFIAHLK